MIVFFQKESTYYIVETEHAFNTEEQLKLSWLFSGAKMIEQSMIEGVFIGPRKEMITPWSTNAVEITQNIGLEGISRIEQFEKILSPEPNVTAEAYANRVYDPMLQNVYTGLCQSTFEQTMVAEPIKYIDDLHAYTKEEGLALSEKEMEYLEGLSQRLGRKLTDSEIFGFSQVNSEHCRHKIFGGTFIIDGETMPESLFGMIKKTSKENPNRLVSAYKDNVAFVEGPKAVQFAPASADKADWFGVKDIDTVISLKAETHNFPTTVEPFNGAATGSGGEIRDRMAGGIGSIPMAGTAVYMTSYPRNDEHKPWEKNIEARKWLYQTPEEILIKASNGASDFGNKFGQPLICGSLLTFEHTENKKIYGFDKVIMLAGGIGFANKDHAIKHEAEPGEKVVVLGGDNYRIGMGGGAVSSVATGEFSKMIELNAVQRSNPEMQKRVFNVVRALTENEANPIVSIHDHGAGGHLNCLSELLEETGGKIDIDKLPIGDKTLSAKEIVGNESQERMGLLLHDENVDELHRIAERERAPMYVVGESTNDHMLVFEQKQAGTTPINLTMSDMLGNPPKTIIQDVTVHTEYKPVSTADAKVEQAVADVFRLEAVGCKDWLTNKVDRSVTGKIARQQCCGSLQLPLSDLGAVAIDYHGTKGIATSLGHAPATALIDAEHGSVMSISEALTNIVWAPLQGGLNAVSLSANWMWPSKNQGEDARLYKAVHAASDFACQLGINIPTGKDSLSMTQKYPDGKVVYSPGTIIVTAVGEVEDVKKIVTPNVKMQDESRIVYIDFSSDSFKLGGSSYAQTQNMLGNETPTVKDVTYFKQAFAAIQSLIQNGKILAGHDISAGGMVTTMFEMVFGDNCVGLDMDLSGMPEKDILKVLFAENAGVLIQIAKEDDYVLPFLSQQGIRYVEIGKVNTRSHHPMVNIVFGEQSYKFSVDDYRDIWYESSYLLDCHQSGDKKALERFDNYKNQQLIYHFPAGFTGKMAQYGIAEGKTNNVKAAIVREKGTNGDREMAYSLYLAGFEVKDIHVTDLMAGRENLEDVNMVVFPGGFSHSDVLGSAKGFASSFLFNDNAKNALKNFFARKDTLSLGVCNGCQLMVELGLIANAKDQARPKMLHNDSHKFESNFVNVDITENHSVMLSSMKGSRLGIWVAHGEGKFYLPYEESHYHIPMKYSYSAYPGNPNGSAYNVAAICSEDGRHLAMMPHLERAIFSWQWGYYPSDRCQDEVSPWIEAFVNARKWIEEHK